MKNYSQSREKVEGWLGRRRTYRCRQCRQKFQVDRLNPLPEKDRICEICRTKEGELNEKSHKDSDISGDNSSQTLSPALVLGSGKAGENLKDKCYNRLK